MKKTSILLAFILIFTSVAGILPAYAASEPYEPPFEIRAEAVYMENMETGQVMVAKNADKRVSPASLTKMMTAILVLENVKDLEGESAYLKIYLNDMIYGTGAQTGGFWPNDKASIKDILYDMVLQSAAECALMLADYVGDGSVGHCVDMMNQRAVELGCTNTNFTNPHGLHDPEQYSSARDMAIIAKHAMTFPLFAEMVSTPSYKVTLQNRDASFYVHSTNEMIKPSSSYYYGPIQGIKTGTLPESGRCLASQAKLNGYTYLTVLLGAPINEADGTPTTPASLNFSETKKLYQWVFDSFSIRTAVERGEELVEVPVKYSYDGDFVRLATAEQFTALLHNDIQASSIQYVPDVPDALTAPVTKGQEVGRLKLIFADEEIGSVPLVATSNLYYSKLLGTWGWITNAIHSYWVKFVIVFVVLIILLYTALLMRVNRMKQRSGKYSSYRSGRDKDYHL
ncbi:MAG: D-alanyl-D-alanine carboxypeptidase family protein [Angelakisella sp.]